MEANISNTTSGSSAEFVSGDLGLLVSLDHFCNTFLDELASAISEAEDWAQKDLQDRAKDNPAWSPYADGLRVRIEESDVLYYSETDDEAVVDLEYGISPNSLLRSTARSHSEHIRQKIETYLEQVAPVA